MHNNDIKVKQNKAKSRYGKYDRYRSTNVINDIRFIEAVDNLPNAWDVGNNTVYVNHGDTAYDVVAMIGPNSAAFRRAKVCIANECDFMARRAMRRKLLVALVLKGYKVVVVNCVR